MSLWKRILSLFNKSDTMKDRLLEQLSNRIRAGRNNEAMCMLNSDPIIACDDQRILLHRAAAFGNEVITRHLITLGYEIDRVHEALGETPLALALASGKATTVKVLLEAGANIHINNANGRNVLEMIFNNLSDSRTEILELLLRRLQSESNNSEEFVDKLLSAGCDLSCAVYLRDSEVIERMLLRGVDVDSKGRTKMTALHFVAAHNEVTLAKLLVDRGADVNALDQSGNSPLMYAARNGDEETMRLLLEAGADPNAQTARHNQTALSCVIDNILKMPIEKSNECLELLLRHGAMPNVSSIDSITLLAWAWSHDESKQIMMLMNYLAILKQLDKPIADSLLPDNLAKFSWKLPALVNLSQQCLVYQIFDNSTVLDLLTDGDAKMRIQVRNDNLMSKLQQFLCNDEYKRIFPLYCSTLTKRISKVKRAMKLEEMAIPIICEILNGNLNLCYATARKIIEYLNEEDLERLAHV